MTGQKGKAEGREHMSVHDALQDADLEKKLINAKYF